MSWLTFALLTIVFYSLFDFLVKLSSSRIHGGLAAFIMNIVSAVVVLIYLIFLASKGEKVIDIKQNGLLFSTLAGLAIGLASIFFVKMFATGTNLSIGVPLIRIGIVLFTSVLGVLLLKETINLKYLVGFILASIGLYLIITK